MRDSGLLSKLALSLPGVAAAHRFSAIHGSAGMWRHTDCRFQSADMLKGDCVSPRPPVRQGSRAAAVRLQDIAYDTVETSSARYRGSGRDLCAYAGRGHSCRRHEVSAGPAPVRDRCQPVRLGTCGKRRCGQGTLPAPAHRTALQPGAVRQGHGINQKRDDGVLELLSITFEETKRHRATSRWRLRAAAPCSLAVECIEVQMSDLGAEWRPQSKPEHDLREQT